MVYIYSCIFLSLHFTLITFSPLLYNTASIYVYLWPTTNLLNAYSFMYLSATDIMRMKVVLILHIVIYWCRKCDMVLQTLIMYVFPTRNPLFWNVTSIVDWWNNLQYASTLMDFWLIAEYLLVFILFEIPIRFLYVCSALRRYDRQPHS